MHESIGKQVHYGSWYHLVVREPSITDQSALFLMKGQGKPSKATYNSRLVLAALQDLGYNVVFIGSSEFILETSLASSVKDALGSVPRSDCRLVLLSLLRA